MQREFDHRRLAAGVLAFVRREGLVATGDRVAVAVSGGPDSVALALLLSEILSTLGATLVGIGHLHHGLRGADADGDEAFCCRLAEQMDVAFTAEHVDARAFAQQHRVSIEAAGHRLRHDFYARVRAQQRANRLATGHTRNDLAETFLMRAFRGAGLRGLGGIRSSRAGLIRPLLDVTRAQVLGYLAARGQAFREDASNCDTTILRNRVRRELLPLLEELVSPRVVDALARTARVAAADDAFLDTVVETQAAALVRTEGPSSATVDRLGLLGLPLALQRRLVRSVLERFGGTTTAAAVDRVLTMAELCAPDEQRLPGWRVRTLGKDLEFARSGARPPVRGSPPPVRVDVGTLAIPGSLRLPSGAVLRASLIGDGGQAQACGTSGGEATAALDAGRVGGPLRVRFRLRGDRIQPLGLDGHKKLQDLFVDRKVPRQERDTVPLVLDADGRIVWVAGYVIAHQARVTASTASVLLLHYRR